MIYLKQEKEGNKIWRIMEQFIKALPDSAHNNKISNVVMLAGVILIQANAEAYRIEDSLKRMFAAFDCKAVIIAQSTSLIVMVTYHDQSQMTLVHRIEMHETNLKHIHIVNAISRNLTAGQCSISEAEAQLLELLETDELKTKVLKWIGSLLLGCSFSLVFKGGFNEFIGSLIVGAVYVVLSIFNEKIQLTELLFILLASLIISLSVILLNRFSINANLHLDSDIVLVSSIMPLVPGIALTNALRDLLHGDYVSGSNRLMEALVVAGTIAVGIGFGIGIGGNSL